MRKIISVKSQFQKFNASLLFIAMLLTSFIAKAQNLSTPQDYKHFKHSLALVISHTQINEGRDENGNKQ